MSPESYLRHPNYDTDGDFVEARDPCSVCAGAGFTTYTAAGCCENYLPSGECCAALYGSDRLVPVEEQEPCGACDGTGLAP